MTIFRLFGAKWRGNLAINKDSTEFNKNNCIQNFPHFTLLGGVILLFQPLLE